MKEMFKKYCDYLEKDRKHTNIFQNIDQKFRESKIDFYEFLEEKQFYNKLLYQFSDYLKNTGILEINISEDNIIFTTKINGIKLIFNGIDRRGVPFELLNFGEYEKNEVDLIQKVSSGEGLQIDVGANIGWFSLILGKKYPNTRILAFEPIFESYKFLNANLLLNGIKNVETVSKAVMEKSGPLSFFFAPESSVLSSAANILDYKNAQKIEVEAITLDEFLSKEDRSSVELLKCDVEGAEYNVIRGSQKLISESKPVIILELFHEWTEKFNYHPDEPIDLLAKFDYQAFLPKKGGLEKVSKYLPNDFSRQNYFFLHKKRHKKLINNHLVV